MSKEHLWSNKDAYRDLLIERADAVTLRDPEFFVALALQQANVIDGVRREHEFRVVRGLFDLIIHIDRPGWPELRDNYDLSNDSEASCDVHVTNSGGDAASLVKAVDRILEKLDVSGSKDLMC